MVRQVALFPAGCQPWNRGICAASGHHFAYCATLAIYIYKLDEAFKEFRLVSIMSEHKKTITSISWHPSNSDILASSGADLQIIVWSISQQRTIAVLASGITFGPSCIEWNPHDQTCLGFITMRGPLHLWHYSEKYAPAIVKDSQNFSSHVSVFRWHPKKEGTVVCGHTDGSISLLVIDFPSCSVSGSKSVRHVLSPDTEDPEEGVYDPITAVAWDPLSTDYLLVANQYCGVRLVDVVSWSVITEFVMPSSAAQVQTLAWIPTAPGMFVTGDVKSGVLRVWSVSKTSPIENIRVKKSAGFHDLIVLGERPSRRAPSCAPDPHDDPRHVSSTSQARSPTLTPQGRFALPAVQLVCTFRDGGVGLYDLGRRSWNFLRDEGHLETIFDCKFRPSDPNQLATASFDGTIKVWDITTMKTIMSSAGNEGILYHISWAPSDLGCIACATAKHGVFIWNVDKGKVIHRIKDHGDSAVFSVSWNQLDSLQIMSCGGSAFCLVHQADGTLLHKFKHPGSVFGGDWSLHNKEVLATGCEDKMVRVYNLATTSDQPVQIFSGHTAKVFHIRWSPLRENILCSGSDDRTVRVWEWGEEGRCVCVLRGHTDAVRGLTWSTELAYLLASGSWDSCIRLWDIRDAACLYVILDHGADVYGLTSHPERPFLLASSSRDSTLRLWSLTPLIQTVELSILARKPLSHVVGTPDRSMCLGTGPLLSGRASQAVVERTQRAAADKDQYLHSITAFSKLLSPPTGADNLWDLVSVARGEDVMVLSPAYKSGIVHCSHLTRFKASEAQELEMVKMSRLGAAIGLPTKEEQLREAANIHLRVGNLQRYCELMVELGQWERAVSVAPGVSLAYWQSLAQRYADYLLQEDNEDIIPFSVATGNTQQLVSYFRGNGQFQEAVMTSQAACEEGFHRPQLLKKSKSSLKMSPSQAELEASQRLLKESSRQQAERFFSMGSPVLAACCHLAVDDFQGAMSKLIRGNELELAVSIGNVLGNVPQQLRLATELLSRRCEHLGKWELGVDLLRTLPDSEDLLTRLCARCAASTDEVDQLHAQAGLPSVDECLHRAEALEGHTDVESVKKCVSYFLLSSEQIRGLKLGLEWVKNKMGDKGWTVDEVWPVLQVMGCVRTDKLQHHQNSNLMYELLALSAYVGALVAIRRGYNPLVPALVKHTRDMMTKEMTQLPFSLHDLEKDLEHWSKYCECGDNNGPTTEEGGGEGDHGEWKQLRRRLGKDDWPVEGGVDCVSCSQLPSHSDVHVSTVTGERIKGLAVFLEDGCSALSVNEAIMWAKVNPFSPLGSGMRITPF